MGTVNDRARVPFALVGVLLVLTSTTLATTTVLQPSEEPPAIEDAMAGATATAVTELRGAADSAATNAAIDPVIEPADTVAGRALNESHPFRDALRLRLYLRAVERLRNVEATRGPVTVSASLPPVEPTTEGYRGAIERVAIDRAGEDAAALAVRIENVTLTATRDGRTVTTAERSPQFVISNPALLLHDRTERFETRGNAPVTRRGLGRRVTARLYPIAWARGHAQYGGAPISTVLGIRHVELATNDALIAEQRATFGEADPDGHRGVAAAGRRVATTDALVGVGGDKKWIDTVLAGADAIGPDPPPQQPVGTWREEPDNPEVTVTVDTSADNAFANTIGVTGTDRLKERIERVHTIEARVETATRFRGGSSYGDRSPGYGWTVESRRNDVSVDSDRVGSGGPTTSGWTTVDSGRYDVIVTETTTRDWWKDNETATTESVTERVYRVEVAAQARTVPIERIPDGRVDGHLSRAADRAGDRAIRNTGGFDDAAEAAALGESVRSTATVTATPSIDRSAVEADLKTVRDRVGDISATVPAPSVGAGRVTPSERLRSAVGDARAGLLPESDRSAPERTIRAARLTYLESLDSELERRVSADDNTADEIGNSLGAYLGPDRLDGALAAHRGASRPEPEPIADPAGNLSLSVETAPSYLTTSAVTRDRIDARGGGSVHPLSTRTVSVFSSPHTQVTTGILDRIPFLNTGRVSLSTAAETLHSMEPGMENRGELEAEVADATDHVRGALVADLVDAGIAEHEAESALSVDASTAEEARMLTDGTTIGRAARSIDGPPNRDRIELRLETTLDSTLAEDAARPPEPMTTAARRTAEAEYRGRLEGILADGIESASEAKRVEVLGEQLGSIPAGLPIAPVPGYWFATANVWYVTLSGQYERFAVRTNRGDGTATTTYLRDGGTVRVVHDGDPKRLGTAAQVSVQTRTAVVVVVPPGPQGVGDTDGEPIKTSPGW
ncbi:MAG: hypothetical protein ACI944_000824 [Natronomonas sp.]